MSIRNLRVYKLLPKQFALKDLSEQRVKISEISELNDPFEFLPFQLSDPVQRAQLKRSRKEFASTKGILSFTKSWSSPLIWSHYSEKHSGIALGFDAPANSAREVLYVQSRLDPAVWLGEGATQATVDALVYTKFAEWAYEDEVRLVVSLHDRDHDGRFYLLFRDGLPLREIILGAKCDLTDKEFKQITKNFPGIPIVKARPAYRSFKVVRKKDWKSPT